MSDNGGSEATGTATGLSGQSDPAHITELLAKASFPAALWSGAYLKFKWANRAFLDLLESAPPEVDVLGMPVRGFLSDAETAVRFQDSAYTGLPFTDSEYKHISCAGDVTFWQLTYLPIPWRVGQPYDVLLTGIDVTAAAKSRRETERERADLDEAISIIDRTVLSSLDPEEILQRSVIEATEVFGADWGWIARREADAWVVRNVHGWPEETIGQRYGASELSLPGLAADAAQAVVEDGCGVIAVEHAVLLERFDIGAFVVIPLFSLGRVTAVMGFCWNAEATLNQPHVDLADKLSMSLSLALENARAYQAEHEVARTLQAAFHGVPPEIEGLEIGHLYHSGSMGLRVGGDFYDVMRLSDATVGLFIGDVSGHGLRATTMTSLVKNSMRAEALRMAAPSQAMARTNHLMLRERANDMYASAFFGVLETDSGRLSYCSAGHPPPILVRQGEKPVWLSGGEMVMGVRDAVRYGNSATHLAEGDLLVLYTDGLTEARDRHGRPFGDERLLDTIGAVAHADAREVPQALFMEAFSHAEGRVSDDVAVLSVRIGSAFDGRQGRLQLGIDAA